MTKAVRLVDLEDPTRVYGLRHSFNALRQLNGVDPAAKEGFLSTRTWRQP
jgi:hypothetical protein